MTSPISVCSIDGCERGGKISRGMCRMHYQRAQKSGEIMPPPLRTGRPIAERLARRLVTTDTGCLEWTGSINADGYGTINTGGQGTLAHRVVWGLVNGPIPDGLCVLHRCDNPPCCQTDPTEGFPEGHLFLGTREDNNADRDAKRRHAGRRAAA